MNYMIECLDQPGDMALWWCPDGKGYTVDIDKAGRFSALDAIRICKHGDNRMVLEDSVLAKCRRVVLR